MIIISVVIINSSNINSNSNSNKKKKQRKKNNKNNNKSSNSSPSNSSSNSNNNKNNNNNFFSKVAKSLFTRSYLYSDSDKAELVPTEIVGASEHHTHEDFAWAEGLPYCTFINISFVPSMPRPRLRTDTAET